MNKTETLDLNHPSETDQSRENILPNFIIENDATDKDVAEAIESIDLDQPGYGFEDSEKEVLLADGGTNYSNLTTEDESIHQQDEVIERYRILDEEENIHGSLTLWYDESEEVCISDENFVEDVNGYSLSGGPGAETGQEYGLTDFKEDYDLANQKDVDQQINEDLQNPVGSIVSDD